MASYVKRLAALLFVTGGLLLSVAVAGQPAYAQNFNPLDKACTGAAAGSAACQDKNDPDSITGPNGIIVRVTNLVALVAGVVAVLVIVIYGIMIVISYGDSGKVTQARNAIIGAAVGLIVIGLSRTIIVFVIDRL
jgi:hypothetical protein